MPKTFYPSESGGRFVPNEAFGDLDEDDLTHSQQTPEARKYRSSNALIRHRENEESLIEGIDSERSGKREKAPDVPWELHAKKSAAIRPASSNANFEVGAQRLPKVHNDGLPHLDNVRTGRGKK